MVEISIYHPPGPFIYTVWNKGRALYVGGTENINAKSFRFNFDYDNITGYYYQFPDFKDELDREIVNKKPQYNTVLRSSFTKKTIIALVKMAFKKSGHSFQKREKERVSELLADCENLEFNGEIFFSSLDAYCTRDMMLDEYGIYNFKS